MGEYRKIQLQNANLEYRNQKELSLVWKNYFSNLSVSLSKLFFRYLKNNVYVQFASRDIVVQSDYFGYGANTIYLRPFKILPYGDLGYILFEFEHANFIMNIMKGAKKHSLDSNYSNISYLDRSLFDNILHDIYNILSLELHALNSQLILEESSDEFYSKMHYLNSQNKLLSVHKFYCQTDDTSFEFDIVFTNKILESFILI